MKQEAVLQLQFGYQDVNDFDLGVPFLLNTLKHLQSLELVFASPIPIHTLSAKPSFDEVREGIFKWLLQVVDIEELLMARKGLLVKLRIGADAWFILRDGEVSQSRAAFASGLCLS